MFDMSGDQRLEALPENLKKLPLNQLEILLKDEFLPIYTHDQYSKVFRDSSMAMDVSTR